MPQRKNDRKFPVVATHKISEGGKLFLPSDFVKQKLDVDPGDEIKHYDVPDSNAVVIIKAADVDFNGLPDRIKNALKTEEQLKDDFEIVKAQIIEEYKGSQVVTVGEGVE